MTPPARSPGRGTRSTGSRARLGAALARALARLVGLAAAWGAAAWPAWAQPRVLPNRPDSLKFAVIGDAGTGGRPQYEVAARMAEVRTRFPFELVLMLGDNLYGGEGPRDRARKFERPYQALLEAGVTFYAVLGNHDERAQRFYPPFNMHGRTYYSVAAPRQSVRFFALESGDMSRRQIAWLEAELAASTEAWKIVFMHHPLYSSGRTHGPDVALRRVLEPLFVRAGVDVVFAGHEHVYERLHPQQGIAYFVSGAAGKLRRGDLRRPSPYTAAGFDADNHFLLVEIAGDRLSFEAVSRTGATVDSGTIDRRARLASGGAPGGR